MTTTIISTRNPHTASLAPTPRRILDGARSRVPQGTKIVSADNHWSLAEDPWQGRFPAHLTDRMPSMFWDEERSIWNMRIGGKVMFDGYVANIFRTTESRAGYLAWRIGWRIWMPTASIWKSCFRSI